MTDSDFLRKLGLEEVAETAEGLEPQFRATQISQALQEALTAFLTADEVALAVLMSLDKEQFFGFAMEMLHDFYHQDHDCCAGEEPPSPEEMQVLMIAFQKRLS